MNIPRGVLEFEVDGHPAVNGIKDLGFADPVSLAGGFMGRAHAGKAVER